MNYYDKSDKWRAFRHLIALSSEWEEKYSPLINPQSSNIPQCLFIINEQERFLTFSLACVVFYYSCSLAIACYTHGHKVVNLLRNQTKSVRNLLTDFIYKQYMPPIFILLV